jgi:group I intron endonuclease
MIVYLITNLVNNKKYVGMDSNNNPLYLGSGTLILKALKKYGRENFKKEILEECTSLKHLEERETWWIKHLNALQDPDFYNLEDNRKRGTNPFANKTEKEKKEIYGKISQKLKGKPNYKNRKPKPSYFSQQQKERFKDRGNRSEESKRKQSESLTGKKQNQKIKNWKQSKHSKTLKPILQFNLEGEFIREWHSIKEAQNYYFPKGKKPGHHNGSHIVNTLRGKTKKAFGYVWKYKK